MKARWLRSLALLATSFAAASCCGRGCGLREGEQSFEKWDGSIKASLVRKTTWEGGGTKVPIWLPSSRFAIRVETTPPFEEPTSCEKVVFADDGKGKTLAFRCHDKSAWTVLRLRGGSRHLRECEAPIGTSDPRRPDFSKLTALSAAAPRLTACGSPPGLLARAIFDDEGEAPALALVDQWTGAGEDGTWSAGARALPPSAAEKALATLCQSLLPEASGVSTGRYRLAASRCKLDDPRLGEGALAMVRRTLADPAEAAPAEGDKADDERADTLRWATVIALRHRPAEIGPLACASLDRRRGLRVDDPFRATMLTAIGRTKTRCDKLAPLLDRPPCGTSVECGNELCDAAALAKDTTDWAIPDLAEAMPPAVQPRPPRSVPADDRALLFALRVNGPLPRAVTLAFARRRYPVAPSPSGAPACSRGVPPSVPCVCASDLAGSSAVCDVDPVTSRAEHGRCNFHVDDVKKRLDDVRSMCRKQNEGCDKDIDDCCLGFLCRPDGKAGLACQPDEGDGATGAVPSAAPSAASSR